MKIIKGFIVMNFLFLLTGCWDVIQLEEAAYIVVIGIDKGENDMLSVTYQIANPQVGSTDKGQAENEEPSSIITLDAPDFISARDLANISVSRRIRFSHTKLIIMSDEFIETGEMAKLVDAFVRVPDLQTDVTLMVSKEKAADFIKNNKPPLETRPHKHYIFMTQRWKDTGLVPSATIERFLQKGNKEAAFLAIHATTEQEEPNPNGKEDEYNPGEVKKEGDTPAQMIGSVVLKGGEKLGELNGEENKIALIMRRYTKAKHWYTTFPDPLAEKSHITLIVERSDYGIEIDKAEDTLEINLDITFDITINYIKSNIDYSKNLDNQKVLEEHLKKLIEKKMNKLIKKSQQEFKIDLFSWNLESRSRFKTVKEYEDYKWAEKYPNADVNVNVTVKIVKFGRQIEPVKSVS